MTFTPFDAQSWPRREVFHYFSALTPTGYSLTVRLDVTALRRARRANRLLRQPDPAVRRLSPDEHTFSLMWTEYDADFSTFYARFVDNQRRYGEQRGLLSQPLTPPPENAYTVSCLPWVSFEHFAVHSYGASPYYLPSVEAGRFVIEDGRTLLPLSITCHHAATDGWHVHLFLEELQALMDDFELTFR